MNYLDKVKEFRAATGLDAGQPEELHDALIREELSELADALADSVVVLCGKCADGFISAMTCHREIDSLNYAAEEVCINLAVAFNIVHTSNMSKLCKRDEVEATERKYNELGVAVEFREVSDDLFACYSVGGNPDYPEGKLLKSVGYRDPDWSGDEWIL